MDDMKLYPQLDASGDYGLVPMPGIDNLGNLKNAFSVSLSKNDLGLIKSYMNRYEKYSSHALESYYEGIRFGMDLILEVIGLDKDMLDIKG